MPIPKTRMDKMSIRIPDKMLDKQLMERLLAIAKKRDRSANYLVIQAIEDFLKREEKK